MPNISIYCEAGEKAGLGHITRMRHLKQAFQDRGLKTYLNAAPDDGSAGKWNPSRNADIIIVDVPNNDNELLRKVRWLLPAAKIVVFVGVGQTVTQRTFWLADLVVCQSLDDMWVVNEWTVDFIDKTLAGPSFIVLDPRIRRQRNGSGIVMYFGAGYSRDYVIHSAGGVPDPIVFWGDKKIIADERHLYAGIAPWPDILGIRKEYIGTMGMAAYDAAAAGCKITVICRTEEHLADAKAAGFSIAGLGEPSIKQIQKARRRAKTCDLIDSGGVYRVAERILSLV